MKSFSILFILAILILEIKGECHDGIPLIENRQCGIAAECAYNARNEYDILNESCRRREQGKAPFLTVQSGICPTDRPNCEGNV
ncbi:accessory gland protein Acp63F-like [Drosophila takahashii]|uniref:accessory gland protein Acp63F-like n=1 Tax=Drosophila takahashii TaxID=29030 RepID=UPI0038990865